MLKIRNKAESNIRWEVQKGNCSFWWDNWTAKDALANLLQGGGRSTKVQVKQFLDNGEWNIDKLNEFLPDHIIDSIAHMEIGDPNEDDFPVWIISNDGNFSSNSACKNSATCLNSSDATNFIWNSIGNALRIKHQQEPVIATFKR
ncbi:uncharacterized protein [Nicotiana tomentosiformis]|uniref:uncharacterized protein n=1 Tax=Nicotiana tomentosiformis TaxID=4098 RepID=UPI00388CE790